VTDISTRKWYGVEKPKPDGRFNTCGVRLLDGSKVLLYARTADDVAQIQRLQDYGYIVTHEIRNKKKATGSEA